MSTASAAAKSGSFLPFFISPFAGPDGSPTPRFTINSVVPFHENEAFHETDFAHSRSHSQTLPYPRGVSNSSSAAVIAAGRLRVHRRRNVRNTLHLRPLGQNTDLVDGGEREAPAHSLEGEAQRVAPHHIALDRGKKLLRVSRPSASNTTGAASACVSASRAAGKSRRADERQRRESGAPRKSKPCKKILRHNPIRIRSVRSPSVNFRGAAQLRRPSAYCTTCPRVPLRLHLYQKSMGILWRNDKRSKSPPRVPGAWERAAGGEDFAAATRFCLRVQRLSRGAPRLRLRRSRRARGAAALRR